MTKIGVLAYAVSLQLNYYVRNYTASYGMLNIIQFTETT